MSAASAGESATSGQAPHRGHSAGRRPKVIYVMGAGHSGSTILGVALGNCDGVFFGGELEEWTLRSGVPKFGGLERTRFWRSVSENVRDAGDLFGTQARDCVERSSAVLRVDRWPARRRLRRRYREVAGELFGAIGAVAGATHVVDTSHFPLRARELQKVAVIELHLILLVRDPQSVVESYVGHINRHAHIQRWARIFTKNLDLWLTYLLSVLVFLRQPRPHRLLVRHEDFIADPQGVLRCILDRAHCSAPMPDLSSLRTGMPRQGNRLLWSDEVSLNSKPILPARGSRLTRMLQLPWTAILARLKPAAPALSSPRGQLSAPASR
jgi:hypothetical protein